MRYCILCRKQAVPGNGTFFNAPRDPNKRAEWSEICKTEFNTCTRICFDHFSKNDIVTLGNRYMLLPKAIPILPNQEEIPLFNNNHPDNLLYALQTDHHRESVSIDTSMNGLRFFTYEELTTSASPKCPEQQFKGRECQTGKVPTTNDTQNGEIEVFENFKQEFKQNFKNSDKNYIPPQLQEEPIMQMLHEESMMQIPNIKFISCVGTTQTNTRLCGLVEASDYADEYRFNCFYCSEVFPLEKWKRFVKHLKEMHYEMEEAFKTSKYVSDDHDYTPINIPQFTPPEPAVETVDFGSKSQLSILVDPLEPMNNPFESIELNSFSFTPNDKFISNNKFLKTDSPSIVTGSTIIKSRHRKQNAKTFFSNDINKGKFGKNYKFTAQRSSKVTPLRRCLKRTKEVEKMEIEGNEDFYSESIEIVQQTPTEISFEYTPEHIVNFLLDTIKLYPVLWQFDDEPFNEDFYEGVEEVCKKINAKYTLNIDNLKMRRSINRIIRYYCYLFPNTNVENINQYTHFYDKCATFLPSAVGNIAYARCSHCYVCYRNDFDLQLHLLEEQRYLQWPYKCAQCKECFRDIEEFEFHKHLPHYDEIFRCHPCKKSFFRRYNYKRHMIECHRIDSNPLGNYKCNLCDRVLQTLSGLRTHKNTHGEKQHRCNLCPKSYHDNSKLRIHLKSHHKEYDCICEVCGKPFIVQAALRRHMKKHTGEKVSCNICGLKLRNSSLRRHLRTVHVVHEGSIESTVIGKHLYYRRLIKSAPLRPVQKRSGEERNYQCKICKINFDNYKLIVEHNKELHSDIPKLPCQMCSTAFSHKMNLKQHYRKKHNLHVYQVYKLVDENEDLNDVLAIDTEHIDDLFATLNSAKNKPDTNTCSNNGTSLETALEQDEIYFEGEKIFSSESQDDTMEVADGIETEVINIDYMSDIFTDF